MKIYETWREKHGKKWYYVCFWLGVPKNMLGGSSHNESITKRISHRFRSGFWNNLYVLEPGSSLDDFLLETSISGPKT